MPQRIKLFLIISMQLFLCGCVTKRLTTQFGNLQLHKAYRYDNGMDTLILASGDLAKDLYRAIEKINGYETSKGINDTIAYMHGSTLLEYFMFFEDGTGVVDGGNYRNRDDTITTELIQLSKHKTYDDMLHNLVIDGNKISFTYGDDIRGFNILYSGIISNDTLHLHLKSKLGNEDYIVYWTDSVRDYVLVK